MATSSVLSHARRRWPAKQVVTIAGDALYCTQLVPPPVVKAGMDDPVTDPLTAMTAPAVQKLRNLRSKTGYSECLSGNLYSGVIGDGWPVAVNHDDLLTPVGRPLWDGKCWPFLLARVRTVEYCIVACASTGGYTGKCGAWPTEVIGANVKEALSITTVSVKSSCEPAWQALSVIGEGEGVFTPSAYQTLDTLQSLSIYLGSEFFSQNRWHNDTQLRLISYRKT